MGIGLLASYPNTFWLSLHAAQLPHFASFRTSKRLRVKYSALGIFLLLCCPFVGLSQIPDSLYSQLADHRYPDLQQRACFDLAATHLMQNSDSVFHYAEQLNAFADRSGNKRAYLQANNLTGRAWHNKGQFAKAVTFFNKAIKDAKQFGFEEELGGLYLNKGLSLGKGFELDSAYWNLQQAAKYFETHQQKDDLWRCYSAFADIHTERGEREAAEQQYVAAMNALPLQAARAERGFLIFKAFSFAFQHKRYELLAQTRIQWDEYKSSHRLDIKSLERPEHLALYRMVTNDVITHQTLLYEAIQHYEETQSLFNAAWCYEDLAEIYLEQNNIAAAIPAYEQANLLLSSIGASAHLAKVRKRLAHCYQASGDLPKALFYTEASYAVIDSIRNHEAEQNLQKFRVQYDLEQKEQALRINTLELAQKTQERNIFILLTSLLVLMVVGLIAFQRHRKKRREMEAEKDKTIQQQRIHQLEQQQKLTALSATIAGQEQERKRIAKDLHDGLGGLLASAKAHFSQIADTQHQAAVQHTSSLIDVACTEVRRISHNLMPAALLYAGLKGALEDLAAQVTNKGTTCNLEILGELTQLTETQQVAIYRIIQEAVHNTMKHANAHTVLVQLMRHDHQLFVTIEDDGVGFDVRKVREKAALGLSSMASRTEMLGGHFQIESVVGEGTTLSFVFSL
ncbi:MAG: ATP-binding protein [Saprospiraceae bacterium]